MKIGMLMCLQWEPLRSSFQLLHTCVRWCRCVNLMGRTRLLPLLHHSSLFSGTFACCLLAFSLSPRIQVSIHPSLPPFVSPSLPPSLAGLYLPAVLRGNYQSLVTVSDCTAMLHFGLPYNTHIRTQKYSVDMVLSRPDIQIILAFFCGMCV